MINFVYLTLTDEKECSNEEIVDWVIGYGPDV